MSASATSLKPRSTASVTPSPAGDVLTIIGEIEDHTRLVQLAPQLGNRAIIDLEGVTFINSIGVREWIMLLDTLVEKGAKVVLRKISEPMVRQMTMVLEARGESTVESFYAPYMCSKCAAERSLLLMVEANRAALDALKPPSQPCPECNGTMEFDEFANRYLAFLG
jgi:anti-anti-sigma regulatory factor